MQQILNDIKNLGLQKKINLICHLSKQIGEILSRKDKEKPSVKENVFIQFAHHLFDGEAYCMNGDIPQNVTKGIAQAFRRYGAHLAGIVNCHRTMDSDYFYLYLSQFLDTVELQNKLNSNALLFRETMDLSNGFWEKQLRAWYSPVSAVCYFM